MEGTKHGQLIAMQLLDVAIRVQAIRKYAVQQCALLLEKACLLSGQPRATMSEVLYAAAWICGEFSRFVFHLHVILLTLCKKYIYLIFNLLYKIYI
jgi:AP-3 complex subunit delta-1